MSTKLITKKDLMKIISENDDDKQLLLDKKKCPKCDAILLDGKDTCDECGYNIKESEEIFETLKKLWDPKFINEQISSPAMNGSVVVSKKDIADKNLVQSIRKSDPKATIQVADEVVKKGKKEKEEIDWFDGDNNPFKKQTKKQTKKRPKKEKEEIDLDEDLQKLEEYMSRIIMDSEQNPKMSKGSFTQFVSKLK